MRRACCASTRCRFTAAGFSKAFCMAFLVISLNITRKNFGAASFLLLQLFLQVEADGLAFAIRVSRQVDGVGALGRRLQLRDQLLLAFDDFVDRLEIVAPRPPPGPSWADPSRGPSEALTTKFLPRYFPIVFAFAGDSTMTRFFAIDECVTFLLKSRVAGL